MFSDIYSSELFIGFVGGWFSYYVCQKICNYRYGFLCDNKREKLCYSSPSLNMKGYYCFYDDDTSSRDYDGNNLNHSDNSNEKKSLQMIISSQTDTISHLCKIITESPGSSKEERRVKGDLNKSSPSTTKSACSSPLKEENTSQQQQQPPPEIIIVNNNPPSKIENELASLFEEEHEVQFKSMKEKLDVGRKIGEEPVAFYLNTSGNKYATLGEVKNAQDLSEKFHNEKKINRSDELEIIHVFNNIRGMKYSEGLNVVRKEGYSLHPVYINRGNKNPRKTYSGTVIGVSINDEEYDYLTNKPSGNATITSIVDVGGQDSKNRSAPSKL
jgi:hypothetical protein